MAQARAEAKQYAAVSERSLSTAWRMGQLGQLGLALLEVGDEQAGSEDQAGDHDWDGLLAQAQSSPPLSEQPISEPLSKRTLASELFRAGLQGEDSYERDDHDEP